VRLQRAAFLALALVLGCAQASAEPRYADVRAAYRPSDTLVLDRHGAVLHRQRTDFTVRRGPWVALADMSPALRTALVLSEDKRFYEHSGVDWRAVSSAAWANLWNTRTRGASTITMQLAGLLDDDLQRGAGGRSVGQKIDQVLAARALERSWRKDQILEAYLNLVPFRGELVGIDALSQTLFGKAAHGLDHREAAVAAALVRAPNAGTAQVAQRACGVFRILEAPRPAIDCLAMDMFTQVALRRRDFAASEGLAPHVARQVVRTAGAQLAGGSAGATITTTLDADLQRFARASLQRHLRELSGRHVEDGALVVLDRHSGAVRAWVGSSGALGDAPEVDGVTALRQPGSTLKPFLYAQALAERRITAASLLEDAPTHIQTAGGLYMPQNYDRQFKGWVSARTALAASLNVPAVRTLAMVSPQAFHDQLLRLGLPLKESGAYYGYSLALGSAEVSLLNLTNAYRALGNGGRWGPTTLLPPSSGTVPEPARPALDPRAAFIVGDILSDGNARARTFGTDSVLATRFWSAVKTGTSKDMRDNWAVGWSQHYVVGVWVGNASGAPMWDVSGISGAAPVWAAVMNYLHRDRTSQAPTPPAGVLQTPVRFDDAAANAPALEARRNEWFIRGTQQAVFVVHAPAEADGRAEPGKAARITAPTNGTIIALDPDIPPQHQRLRLQAEGAGQHWRVDGRRVASGPVASWLPWPGRHRLQWVDAQGRVRDEVRIEVRGAGVKLSRAAAAAAGAGDGVR
jgi:penicillin-binding protein 1C